MIDGHDAGTSDAADALRTDGVLIVEQGGRGGCADYTGCLAPSLAQRGIPVTLATADDHLFKSSPGVRIVPVFGYTRGHSRAARLARRMRLGPAINGVRFLLAMPSLVALARRSALVHVQGWERPSLGVIATLLMRAVGARIVYTSHNVFERLPHTLDSARIFPAMASATIVHTDADRARLDRPVIVIPHGSYAPVADSVRPVPQEAARAELGIGAETLVVLLFGHLRPDKGLDDLLDALARAPSWHGLVAGEEDGALAKLGDRVSSAERAGRVTLREGFHDMEAVARFFSAADLVALPYRQASQSGVLLLAYGFTRPVVAYPVGGLLEAVIDGSTGWICEEAKPDALAKALGEAEAAGRQELRRRGEVGRRWSTETFGWDRIAERTEAVYESVLAERPKKRRRKPASWSSVGARDARWRAHRCAGDDRRRRATREVVDLGVVQSHARQHGSEIRRSAGDVVGVGGDRMHVAGGQQLPGVGPCVQTVSARQRTCRDAYQHARIDQPVEQTAIALEGRALRVCQQDWLAAPGERQQRIVNAGRRNAGVRTFDQDVGAAAEP